MSFRLTITVLLSALFTLASAHAGGFNWRDHAQPYTFLFGNHIDAHQQTRLEHDAGLKGFLYIVFVDQDGDGLIDRSDEGLPIAEHCSQPEDYPNCQVGWQIRALPCIEEINGCGAMFLYHQDDHPVWLIGPRTLTVSNGGEEYMFLAGSREFIPQPGFPGHFHWLTNGSATQDGVALPSSLAEVASLLGIAIEVPEECNVSQASELTPGIICPGYFFELLATGTFAFEHGGEKIPVRPGIDLSSHHNFITSYKAVDPLNSASESTQP